MHGTTWMDHILSWKVRLAFLVLLAAPLIGGCSQGLLAVGTPPLSQTVADDRAMYALEATFNGASTALLEATRLGVLTGEDAAKAQRAYETAYRALLQAREAHRIGNHGTFFEQANFLHRAAGEIFSLIRGN